VPSKCDLIRTSPLTQLPLMLTSREVVRDESRRNEVVALLARLLLQAAQARESVELSDDAP
jgi:hypothetical protein